MTINVKSQNFNGGLIGGISTTQVSGDNLSGYNKSGLFFWTLLKLQFQLLQLLKIRNELYSKR